MADKKIRRDNSLESKDKESMEDGKGRPSVERLVERDGIEVIDGLPEYCHLVASGIPPERAVIYLKEYFDIEWSRHMLKRYSELEATGDEIKRLAKRSKTTDFEEGIINVVVYHDNRLMFKAMASLGRLLDKDKVSIADIMKMIEGKKIEMGLALPRKAVEESEELKRKRTAKRLPKPTPESKGVDIFDNDDVVEGENEEVTEEVSLKKTRKEE